MSAVEQAWDAYADDARRLVRVLADPLATDRVRAAQRRAAQRSFRAFYGEFTGRQLPQSYEEIFKQTLDRRGRPVTILRVVR